MYYSVINVLLLLFGLTCAQYEAFIPARGTRPASVGGFGHSPSRATNTVINESPGNPASTGSLYPNAPVPIAYPPFQTDPSYPNQQQEVYPRVIPGNGPNSEEPVYVAMLPMQQVYQQYYQDQDGGAYQSNYTSASQGNDMSDPSVPNPTGTSYPATTSYPTDPSNNNNNPSYPATTSYPTDPSNNNNNPSYPATPSYPTDPSNNNNNPSYPATPSYPTDPSNNNNPSYPATPSYPTDPSNDNNPSYPATPSYPTDPSNDNNPSYPATPSYPTDPSNDNNPSYPATTSFPNNQPYPATSPYPNDPSYLSTPSYDDTQTDPVAPSYPNNYSDPSTPSYATNPPYASTTPYPNNQPYPNTSPYAINPKYPATTSYPNNPPYSSPLYPNAPAHPNLPASSQDSTYSETPQIADNLSNRIQLDQQAKDYSLHGVKAPGKLYPCAGNSDGKKYAVNDVCFAYFVCEKGESVYRQCDDHYRFDEVSGQCDPDISCLSACPDKWEPHPSDIYKFILGGKEMDCPYGTFFDYKICTCQSKNNLPQDHRY